MGQKKASRASGSRARKKAGETERQQYWDKHLRTCEGSGETIKAYAARHGFSPYALYEARRRQRGSNPSRGSGAERVSFVKVSAPVSTSRESRWRVRFLNGTIVEWGAAPEGEALASLLKSISHFS